MARSARLGQRPLSVAVERTFRNADGGRYKGHRTGYPSFNWVWYEKVTSGKHDRKEEKRSENHEEKHVALEMQQAQSVDPEDEDEYLAENIFWVPKEARWSFLQANAKQPII